MPLGRDLETDGKAFVYLAFKAMNSSCGSIYYEIVLMCKVECKWKIEIEDERVIHSWEVAHQLYIVDYGVVSEYELRHRKPLCS